MDDNEPVNFRDAWGLEAGQTFDTEEEAIIDFGKTYNDDSINENKEVAATVYQDSNGKYYYPTPNEGTEADCYFYTPPLNQNDKPVQITHTHGSTTTQHNNEVLSDKDKETAELYNLPVTAVTPGGNVQGYDPNTDSYFDYSDPNIPSDPKSGKDRKTTVDPSSGNKDPTVPKDLQQEAPPPPTGGKQAGGGKSDKCNK